MSGDLGRWAQQVAGALNATPRISYTSYANPDSYVTGAAGDILVNIASDGSTPRLWIKQTDTAARTGWAASSSSGAGTGAVNSVSGTANRITTAPTTGDVVVDVASGYVGQNTITTLGTITTGVWQGTAVADAYIASAATWNAKEAGLGNPAADNYVLQSTALGVRSWVSKPASLSAVENTALSTWVGSVNITTLGTIGTGTWNATTIAVGKGGTGLTSYAVGDILYASVATTLAGLADVAAGSVLVSGGVGVAPAWSATPSVTSLTATTLTGTLATASQPNVTTMAALVTAGALAVTSLTSSGSVGIPNGAYFTGKDSGGIVRGMMRPTSDNYNRFVPLDDTMGFQWANNAQTVEWGRLTATYLNIAGSYQIGGTSVLTATTLGAGVVNSSLTTLGTITTGVWQGTAVTDTYIASAATWNAKEAGLGNPAADNYVLQSTALGVRSWVSKPASLSAVENTALSTWVGSVNITTLGTIGTGTWNATTIAVGKGGTGLTSYAVGDILYASVATTLAGLADVAAGSVLVSGGVGVAPAWSATPSVTSLTATTLTGTLATASQPNVTTMAALVTAGALAVTSLTSSGSVGIPNGAYFTGKDSGGIVRGMMRPTSDNYNRFVPLDDTMGFQWTNNAQTVEWARLTATYLNIAGLLTTTASAAVAGAGLRLPHGVAPDAPVNGDLWTTSAGLYVRINGATVGPLS